MSPSRPSSFSPTWHKTDRTGDEQPIAVELFRDEAEANTARRHFARRPGYRAKLFPRRLRAPGVDVPVWLFVRYRTGGTPR